MATLLKGRKFKTFISRYIRAICVKLKHAHDTMRESKVGVYVFILWIRIGLSHAKFSCFDNFEYCNGYC